MREVDSRRSFASAASDVAAFCADRDRSPSSAFITLLRGSAAAGSPPELAGLFRAFVEVAVKTAGSNDCFRTGIDGPDWRLTIADTPLFALTLSNCYPLDHPRYLSGPSAFVFQPEALFAFHGITSNGDRSKYTAVAHEMFAKRGRRFFSHHDKGTPKALRFVLDSDGYGLRWWQIKAVLP